MPHLPQKWYGNCRDCRTGGAAHVLRSYTRGSRSSAAIPYVEIQPETETGPEPEIDNTAEIQVSMSPIYEGGLGATRPYIPETASQYVTSDKPETTAAFPVSQEIVVESNPNLTANPNPPPHTIVTLLLTRTVFEIFDFRNAVTLKTGLGSVKVIENVTIRWSACDFLLTFYSNYGSISCRF